MTRDSFSLLLSLGLVVFMLWELKIFLCKANPFRPMKMIIVNGFWQCFSLLVLEPYLIGGWFHCFLTDQLYVRRGLFTNLKCYLDLNMIKFWTSQAQSLKLWTDDCSTSKWTIFAENEDTICWNIIFGWGFLNISQLLGIRDQSDSCAKFENFQ